MQSGKKSPKQCCKLVLKSPLEPRLAAGVDLVLDFVSHLTCNLLFKVENTGKHSLEIWKAWLVNLI